MGSDTVLRAMLEDIDYCDEKDLDKVVTAVKLLRSVGDDFSDFTYELFENEDWNLETFVRNSMKSMSAAMEAIAMIAVAKKR